MLRPHQPIEEMTESEPPDAFAVGAFFDEELVGVGLVGPEGGPGRWRVRGMATWPEARGRGAGSAILDALIAHARAQGANELWASVRTPVRTLYERGGFRVDSDVYELPHIAPHVVMRLPVR